MHILQFRLDCMHTHKWHIYKYPRVDFGLVQMWSGVSVHNTHPYNNDSNTASYTRLLLQHTALHVTIS